MTPFDRAALARILDALDSEHAGEALAAARLASAMVRAAGVTWSDVLRDDPPAAPRRTEPAFPDARPGEAIGGGPMDLRRERDLSPYEQFFMLLLSPRTPGDVKRELRGWESRVLDGGITPQETQDLCQMFNRFVA